MLDGDGLSTPRPGRFTSGTESQYPLCRKLGGLRSRSGCVRKIWKSLPPPELETLNVQPAASRYIDYSIPVSRTVRGSVLKIKRMCLGLLAKGLGVFCYLLWPWEWRPQFPPKLQHTIQCHVAREPPDKTINKERILNLESILFLVSWCGSRLQGFQKDIVQSTVALR